MGERLPMSIAIRRPVLSFSRTGDIMIRTQISFEERDYALAKKEAKNLGISLSELVRRSVRRSA
jgi:hypothetical protein